MAGVEVEGSLRTSAAKGCFWNHQSQSEYSTNLQARNTDGCKARLTIAHLFVRALEAQTSVGMYVFFSRVSTQHDLGLYSYLRSLHGPFT